MPLLGNEHRINDVNNAVRLVDIRDRDADRHCRSRHRSRGSPPTTLAESASPDTAWKWWKPSAEPSAPSASGPPPKPRRRRHARSGPFAASPCSRASRSVSTVPAGSASKAALVGAKTREGPVAPAASRRGRPPAPPRPAWCGRPSSRRCRRWSGRRTSRRRPPSGCRPRPPPSAPPSALPSLRVRRPAPRPAAAPGRLTWITPFDWSTSAMVTVGLVASLVLDRDRVAVIARLQRAAADRGHRNGRRHRHRPCRESRPRTPRRATTWQVRTWVS